MEHAEDLIIIKYI